MILLVHYLEMYNLTYYLEMYVMKIHVLKIQMNFHNFYVYVFQNLGLSARRTSCSFLKSVYVHLL